MNPRRPSLKFADATVLQDWFSPMMQVLQKVRFSDGPLSALPTAEFILSGCLRQLLDARSLRDFVQTLFHQDAKNCLPPIARSTWADALASPKRSDILRQALALLVEQARATLTDRLAHLPGLAGREVIATDATYLTESAHYPALYPGAGGTDNQKGHMLLSHFDVRKGIALAVNTQTHSMGEMRVLKQVVAQGNSWLDTRRAIHVVDRAFIDGAFWDQRLQRFSSTVITRLKSSLLYTAVKDQEVLDCADNQGVVFDRQIKLKCSNGVWRLIGFISADGQSYEYITNDLSLLPGVVAFLYHRRWDKEKYYDTFKNDLAGMKAWGKSVHAIQQQAMLGIVTTTLTRLFLLHQQPQLNLSRPDSTQQLKHNAKLKNHQNSGTGISLRANWTELSKITRQLWRFLKHCFAYPSSLALYQRQLAPILERYI